MKREPPKTLRCAIYTRVSTEHGLEQEFNSLDNQRESSEAYIKSQAHEGGWRLVPTRYDDGGFSGGSMERPALQRLLADIRSRLVDVVVVYKVDRLTRSLTDFARLVELFDAHQVSFVSVTQSFNTTTSMGRLTLNVLLSFAQFEREVTGERIRDKIAASKKKGIWMGGIVPLGYRVVGRKLTVDEDEARTVRLIFERYVALGSLAALQRELRERGILTRERRMSSGRVVGGVPLTNGPLGHLLRNRVYLGEINHHGQSHPGEHEAIVDLELFDGVQRRLDANHAEKRAERASSQALLTGRIVDDRGNRMTPSFAVKNGVRYRYHVSCVLAQGRQDQAGSVRRVPAADIEAAVLQALRLHQPGAAEVSPTELIQQQLERVVVRSGALELSLSAEGEMPCSAIHVPWAAPPTIRKRSVVAPASVPSDVGPIRAEARARLLEGIAKARRWLEQVLSGAETTADIARREDVSERSVRMTLGLAFLAPQVVKAAVTGQIQAGRGICTFADAAADWRAQLEPVRR